MQPEIPELLADATARLTQAGVDSPRLSAELLLAHVLGCSRLDLVVHPEREVPEAARQAFLDAVARREEGEPVAYLTGVREFYGLDFGVAPGVLIPRPETELIVEGVEERYDKDVSLTFADWGTGSGCLAVTLAVRFSNFRGTGVDLSPKALALARANAEKHGVAERLTFLLGDFTESLHSPGSLDLLVSNPPYVTDNEFLEGDREVMLHEPEQALRGGPDGLDLIRPLLDRAAQALRPGGRLFMEIGCDQGYNLLHGPFAESQFFGEVALLKDLAGRDRAVIGVRL